jgi:hypothetical protein
MEAVSTEAMIEAYQRLGQYRLAAKELGVSEDKVRRCVIRHAEKPPEKPGRGRSLSEFRDTYDRNTIVPQKIRAALGELGAGWAYEVEFSKLAGIGLSELAAFRDMFSDHVVSLKRDSKRAWAGTASVAQKMREMVN